MLFLNPQAMLLGSLTPAAVSLLMSMLVMAFAITLGMLPLAARRLTGA
jgi:hypothetical protein